MSQNMTRGIAPSAQPIKTDQELLEEKLARPRNIFIPQNIFKEFTDVTIDNEEFFTYVGYYVIM